MPKALLFVALLLAAPIALAAPVCEGSFCAGFTPTTEGYGEGSCRDPEVETLRREEARLEASAPLGHVVLLAEHRCHGTDFPGSRRLEASTVVAFEANVAGTPVYVTHRWVEHEQSEPGYSKACRHEVTYGAGPTASGLVMGCTEDVTFAPLPPTGHVGPADIPSLP